MTPQELELLEKLMAMHTAHLRDKFISGSASHPDQSFDKLTLYELLTEIYHEAIDQMHYAAKALLKLQEPDINPPPEIHEA